MSTRSRLRYIALGAAALVLQAQAPTSCNGAGVATTAVTDVAATAELPAGDIAGTYVLARVNGRALPFAYSTDEEGCREEIVHGSLVIRADGTFSRSLTEREACPGDDVEQETETENGRVIRSGNNLRFDNDDDDHAVASGNEISWRTNDYSQPLTLIFRR